MTTYEHPNCNSEVNPGLCLPCILKYPSCGRCVLGWESCRPRGSCYSNTTHCNCTPWLSHWKGLWIADILFKAKEKACDYCNSTEKATQPSSYTEFHSRKETAENPCTDMSPPSWPDSFHPSASWASCWNWSPVSSLFWLRLFRMQLPEIRLSISPPLSHPGFSPQKLCFHEALCCGFSYRILYSPHIYEGDIISSILQMNKPRFQLA